MFAVEKTELQVVSRPAVILYMTMILLGKEKPFDYIVTKSL